MALALPPPPPPCSPAHLYQGSLPAGPLQGGLHGMTWEPTLTLIK